MFPADLLGGGHGAPTASDGIDPETEMALNAGDAAAAGRGAPFDAFHRDEALCGGHLLGSCLRVGMIARLIEGTTGEMIEEMTGETTGMTGRDRLCVGTSRSAI
jgi:hypothetical protein